MQSLSVPLLPTTRSPFCGETRLVRDEETSEAHDALMREGALVVHVGCESAAPGRLAEKIEGRIETELSARGASSPGLGTEDERDALLSDQLFRARRLGHRGLCVSLSGLERLAMPIGGLDAADARTLRFYTAASRERPVALLLRESDRSLIAFAAPIPLLEMLELALPHPPPSPSREREPETSLYSPPLSREGEGPGGEVSAPVEDLAVAVAVAVAEEPVVSKPVVAEGSYKPWVAALHAARGPQPLATFERLFKESYLPLANAIAGGLKDPKALAAHDEFQRTFSRAYSDACPTFVLTGKRPKMVLDAHDLAKKLARMHGARSAHLVLVDAMRWDVGAMVRDHLSDSLGGRASLAGEMALFSAMPTVTSRQLEGLTRGIESLRVSHDPEREADPVRGRTSEMIRRVKVGTRDVFKLDAIEAGLAKAQVHALEVLPELAKHAADAIAKQAKTLPARTLLFVFGDHGFIVDEEGVAHQGGASPEEVIVPAFAFLTGELH